MNAQRSLADSKLLAMSKKTLLNKQNKNKNNNQQVGGLANQKTKKQKMCHGK